MRTGLRLPIVLADVIERWLNTPLSASAVAGGEIVDDFDGEEGEEMFVRNYVTTTMIREELSQSPVIRDLKMNSDKILSMALRSLEGWASLGHVRRLDRKVRWYCRAGLDNPNDPQEFVPVSAVWGLGAAPEEPEPSVDDLLG